MNILFLGDVFGQPGRDAVCASCPALVDEHDRRLRHRQRRERRQRRRHHLEARPEAARRRRRRDHHRQPRLAPARGLSVPRLERRASCGRPTSRRRAPAAASPCAPARDGDEVAVINLMGQVFMGTGISPFRIVDAPGRRGPDAGRDHRRRPARRGDQREGRHGAVPGRPGHGGDRHAHARADRRRARAAPRAPRPSPTSACAGRATRSSACAATSSCDAFSPSCRRSSRWPTATCASTPSSSTAEGGRATAIERLERRC